MGEIQIREVLPREYEDTGSLTQRAYAEYEQPGDPLWDDLRGFPHELGHVTTLTTEDH